MVWLGALSGLLVLPTQASAGISAIAGMAATTPELTLPLSRDRVSSSLTSGASDGLARQLQPDRHGPDHGRRTLERFVGGQAGRVSNG
jgi:hypothetical protein